MPAKFAAVARALTDELDRAQTLTGAMLADAQERRSVIGFLAATARRGLIALRRGALAEAEADTRASLELDAEHNLTIAVPVHAAYLGRTLLERGKLDQAAAAVEEIAPGLSIVAPSIAATLLEARGRVRLARGQRTLAIADLRHCGQLADHMRLSNPNLFTWRSALALALAPEHPREVRELTQEELKLARRAGSSRAIGIALRACGLLADAQHRIEITERNCGVLADRIEAGMAELAAAARARPGDPEVAWHGGLPMPLSSELALLLGELLVHGYDIARASGQPWTIPPVDAGLVFAGAVPVLPYLVNQADAVGVRATFDVRLRVYGRAGFVFEGGSLRVLPQPDGPVDCRLSADPVAFLLVMFGRSDPIPQVLTGKIVAWGRKPWLGFMLPRLLLSP